MECAASRKGADVEEGVRRQRDDIERPLEVKPANLALEPGGVSLARRRELRAVVGVETRRDVLGQHAHGGRAQTLIWKAPHGQERMRLQASKILVEVVIHRQDSQARHQGIFLTGVTNPSRPRRSSAVIAKRTTAAT